MPSNAPDLIRRGLQSLAAVYVLVCLSYLAAGEWTLDLAFKIRVDDLRNSVTIFLAAAAGRMGIFIASRYARAGFARYLAAAGWLFEAALASHLLIFAWYAVEGPFTASVPLVIRVDGFLKPALILAALVIALAVLELRPPEAWWAEAVTALQRARLGAWLAAVFLFAAFLRLWGLGHGLEHNIFHVDAPGHLDTVKIFLHGRYLLRDNYPYFGMHFVEFALRGWLWLVDTVGYPSALVIEDRVIALAARLLNVVYGLGVMGMVYGIGAIIGQRPAGALAAFVTGASLLAIQMTKYEGNDFPMSFLAMLAVYFMALNLWRERALWYLLSGAVMAMAFAAKYNALLSLLVIGFIALRLIRSWRDTLARAGMLILMLMAFAATLAAISPEIQEDAIGQLEGIQKNLQGTSHARGVVANFKGAFYESRIAPLYDGFWRHAWDFEGMFLPVPAIVAILGLAVTAWRFRGSLAFLWLAPLLMFFLGKAAKPNSVAYQYLNAAPLLILAMSIGLYELYSRVRPARLRAAAAAVFVFYVGYHAVEDTSLWKVKPVGWEFRRWVEGNLSVEVPGWAKTLRWEGFWYQFREESPRPDIWPDSLYAREEKAPPQDYIVAGFYNSMRQAVTFWRDGYVAFWLDERKYQPPLFFPRAQFSTGEADTVLYPSRRELAATDKMFMTREIQPPHRTLRTRVNLRSLVSDPFYQPVKEREGQIRRLIPVRESPESILVWGKNCGTDINELYGAVGDERFVRALYPSQAFLLEFYRPHPTRLYYHKFYEMSFGSRDRACWYVAVNEEDKGDALLRFRLTQRAMEAYFKADTPYALLRVMAHGSAADRGRAHQRIAERYPRLLEPGYPDAARGSWEAAANYPDFFFKDKLSRSIEYQYFKNGKKTPNGLVLSEGGEAFGQYLPLMMGEYRATIRWGARGDAAMTVDVVTDYGATPLIQERVYGEAMRRGELTLTFEVEDMAEGPVEIRVRRVTGGDVVIEDVVLTADHAASLATLIKRARLTAD